MPSPMPGMDPYLEDEKLWPLFHTHLVHSLYQLLLPGLMDRYRARLAERKYVVEQALFTSIIREEHREPFLEVRLRPTAASSPSTWSAPPTRARAPAAKRTWTSGRSFASTTPVSWRSTLCFRVNACTTTRRARTFRIGTTPSPSPARCNRNAMKSTRPRSTSAASLPPAAGVRRSRHRSRSASRGRARYDQGDFIKQIDYRRDPLTKLNDLQKKWLSNKLHEQKLRQ